MLTRSINDAQEGKLTLEEESSVASWWSRFSPEDMTGIEHGGKLVLLMDILNQCELIGDKVLVFSQSLASLNLIEEFLAHENERNEKNCLNLANVSLIVG
jgi:transcriptional regulator ATRX